MRLLVLTVLFTFACKLSSSQTMQSCNSLVYCQGKLLDVVQRARIYPDSKTFVDMIQINPSSVTLKNFDIFMKETNNKPTVNQVREFVQLNFVSEGELESWYPNDLISNPAFLDRIHDSEVKWFAKSLVRIWPMLARTIRTRVKDNPDRYSLIPVPNGFIVPGGRFKEIYYWDSYWIIKGLLLCEMYDTVRSMLENMLFLVKTYGFVPNGSRVYYLNRSQPPLLSLMIGLYIDATHDLSWLSKNVKNAEKELEWWLKKRTTTAKKNGVQYTLARYACESGTPRPESYYEDIHTCSAYTTKESLEYCYKNLKSGAESGWDFSSRWIFDPSGGINSNLTYTQTTRVAPVDLNSYLCKAFRELSRFYELLGNIPKSQQWKSKSLSWQKAIEVVFYDKVDGIWYDFDLQTSTSRKSFYPSNFAPLWAEAYNTSYRELYGARAAAYFIDQGIDKYEAGIPTSLIPTAEQWDSTNAWPPLQEIVIEGLEKTGDPKARELARTFAIKWIEGNMEGYKKKREMYEKYHAGKFGQYGGGGEYAVQLGFGWTNGVALSLIDHFYRHHHSGQDRGACSLYGYGVGLWIVYQYYLI